MQDIDHDIFEDTKTAFVSKSLGDLKKTYALFSILKFPFLVKTGNFFLNRKLLIRLFFKGLVKNTIFKTFCGGETIESCADVAQKLSKFKIQAILDYSVEQNTTKSFDKVTDKIIETIIYASKHSYISFSVFKVTALAPFDLLAKIHNSTILTETEKQTYKTIKIHIDRICSTAYKYQIPVLIDTEESWIQKPIDMIVQEMMQTYNQKRAIVYQTFQMYLKASFDKLKEAFLHSTRHRYFLGAKIVRGAYLEKECHRAKLYSYPSPTHDTKQECDEDFNQAVHFCMGNLQRIWCFLGSHNERSNIYALKLIRQYNYKPDDPRIHFAQLYGMSDKISYKLGAMGYLVSKYIPFGPVEEVIPYLLRRLKENSFVVKQTDGELNFLRKEIKRRRKEG